MLKMQPNIGAYPVESLIQASPGIVHPLLYNGYLYVPPPTTLVTGPGYVGQGGFPLTSLPAGLQVTQTPQQGIFSTALPVPGTVLTTGGQGALNYGYLQNYAAGFLPGLSQQGIIQQVTQNQTVTNVSVGIQTPVSTPGPCGQSVPLQGSVTLPQDPSQAQRMPHGLATPPVRQAVHTTVSASSNVNLVNKEAQTVAVMSLPPAQDGFLSQGTEARESAFTATGAGRRGQNGSRVLNPVTTALPTLSSGGSINSLSSLTGSIGIDGDHRVSCSPEGKHSPSHGHQGHSPFANSSFDSSRFPVTEREQGPHGSSQTITTDPGPAHLQQRHFQEHRLHLSPGTPSSTSHSHRTQFQFFDKGKYKQNFQYLFTMRVWGTRLA